MMYADPYHCLNYCVKTQHLLQTIDIYHVNIVYWHLDMNHLAGKARLKNQQKSIYSKSCQDIIELCEIRDGLSSCDTLSNDDICKIIDIIYIE